MSKNVVDKYGCINLNGLKCKICHCQYLDTLMVNNNNNAPVSEGGGDNVPRRLGRLLLGAGVVLCLLTYTSVSKLCYCLITECPKIYRICTASA